MGIGGQDMSDIKVRIMNMEETRIYGLRKMSNDKTISADIRIISEKYHLILDKPDAVLPFYVLSRNYDVKSRGFELFIGGTLKNEKLEYQVIPAGKYACITVRPKLGFLWGAAVGEAKTYFYTKWLPDSMYEALNLEYEYHTEKSMGRHASVDIMFAVRKNH